MIRGSSASGCELIVDAREAILRGTPDELRSLATWLGETGPTVDVELSAGGKVRRSITDASAFRMAVEEGNVLVISGSVGALTLVVGALSGVADRTEEDRIDRHEHLEYLGEGDAWRAPDTLPLIIEGRWPV